MSVIPIDEAARLKVIQAVHSAQNGDEVDAAPRKATDCGLCTELADVAVSAYLGAVGAEVEYGLAESEDGSPHTVGAAVALPSLEAEQREQGNFLLARFTTPWKPLTDTTGRKAQVARIAGGAMKVNAEIVVTVEHDGIDKEGLESWLEGVLLDAKLLRGRRAGEADARVEFVTVAVDLDTEEER